MKTSVFISSSSQFMKFMNNKKSRVTDLFRKMDTDNDGMVPRDDFRDGIIKSSKSLTNMCFH